MGLRTTETVRSMISKDVGDRIVHATLTALHEAGIQTHHMQVGGRVHRTLPVSLVLGPLTITAKIALVAPERDNPKALKLGPAVGAYVARFLSIPDDAAWFRVRIYTGTQNMMVEITRPDPWTPTYADLEELAIDDLLIAADTYGRAVRFNVGATAPGLALVGKTRSGKSSLARLILMQLLQRGWQLLGLIDLKNDDDYSAFAPFAPPQNNAFNNADAERVIGAQREECELRMAGANPKSNAVVMVDELPQLSAANQSALAMLASICASANIRLILAGQRLGSSVDVLLRSQLTTRIVAQVASSQDSADATGLPGAGAEQLARAGDMLLVEDGSIRRIATAYVSDEELRRHLAQIPIPPHELEAETDMSNPNDAQRYTTMNAFINQTMTAWEAEAATHPQKKAPPRWLLLEALRYTRGNNGQLMSYSAIQQLHRDREEAGISHPRCDQVRDACATWWNATASRRSRLAAIVATP